MPAQQTLTPPWHAHHVKLSGGLLGEPAATEAIAGVERPTLNAPGLPQLSSDFRQNESMALLEYYTFGRLPEPTAAKPLV